MKNLNNYKLAVKAVLIGLTIPLIFLGLTIKKSQTVENFHEATLDCVVESISRDYNLAYEILEGTVADQFETEKERTLHLVYRQYRTTIETAYCLSNVFIDYPELATNDSLIKAFRKGVDTTIYDVMISRYSFKKKDSEKSKLNPDLRLKAREILRGMPEFTVAQSRNFVENEYDKLIDELNEMYAEYR